MKQVEKVDWFCPKCNSYVSSESVTHEETHQICNTRVILEPLNQNKMKQTAVDWLVEKIQQANPTFKFDALIREAKAMERMQREKDFVCGYKTRALGSNLIFDETSEMYAIKLFKETFKSE